MKKKTKCEYGNRFYEITSGNNKNENTEYLQLSEMGPAKMTPILFVVKTIPEGEITISMHYEGLPFKVFSWFCNYIKKQWGLKDF